MGDMTFALQSLNIFSELNPLLKNYPFYFIPSPPNNDALDEDKVDKISH